jgi:hypothetical protein
MLKLLWCDNPIMDKWRTEMHGNSNVVNPSDCGLVIFSSRIHSANYVTNYLPTVVKFSKALVGAYKGVVENSWLVKEEDFQKVRHLTAGEESVLHLSSPDSRGRRKADLYFLATNQRLSLGLFFSTDKETAEKQDGFTVMFNNDYAGHFTETHFICAHVDAQGEVIAA